MDEQELRVYTVHVQQTVVFYDVIEVTAATGDEACERAVQEFRCDWSNSSERETIASATAVKEA